MRASRLWQDLSAIGKEHGVDHCFLYDGAFYFETADGWLKVFPGKFSPGPTVVCS